VPNLATDNVLGWIAIGAAASLAGMIWPFRRGAVGVVVNLLAGTSGALLAVLASYAFLPAQGAGATSDRARLFYAALGAIASLGILHAAWNRVIDRRRRAAQ
jgi:uncharacterized membrane protein YeaQ/YmgE (transglycosylase-associated protein family)